jgi:hypothetical protein
VDADHPISKKRGITDHKFKIEEPLADADVVELDIDDEEMDCSFVTKEQSENGKLS